jgi:hypothetical protein
MCSWELSSKWLCPASKKRKSRNFDAFLKKILRRKTNKKRDYADFAYALTKILNLVPTDMVLDNLAFKIDDNGNKTHQFSKKLRLTNKQLRLP